MYKRINSTFLPTRNSKGCPFHLLHRVLSAKLCSAIRTHTSAQAQVRAGAADQRTDIRDNQLTGSLEFKVEFSSNKEGGKGRRRGSKSFAGEQFYPKVVRPIIKTQSVLVFFYHYLQVYFSFYLLKKQHSPKVVPLHIQRSSINAYRALIYPCAVMTVNQSSANKSSGLLGQGGVNNKHRSHLSSLRCLYL